MRTVRAGTSSPDGPLLWTHSPFPECVQAEHAGCRLRSQEPPTEAELVCLLQWWTAAGSTWAEQQWEDGLRPTGSSRQLHVNHNTPVWSGWATYDVFGRRKCDAARCGEDSTSMTWKPIVPHPGLDKSVWFSLGCVTSVCMCVTHTGFLW